MSTPATPPSFAAALEQALGGQTFDPAPSGGSPNPPPAADPAAAPAPDPEPAAPKPTDTPAPEPAAKKPEPLAPLEAVVPDAPPAEPVAVDPDKQYDDLFKTNAGRAFKETKEEIKKLRAEREELSKKLADLEAAQKTATPPKEVQDELARIKAEAEELRKINAQAEEALALARVEATREYRETVGKHFEAVNTAVKDLATRYEVSPDSLMKAIQEPDRAKRAEALAEVAADFQEMDRHDLYELSKLYAVAKQQDDVIRQNAKAAAELIEANRKKQLDEVRQRSRAELDHALSATWGELTEAYPMFKEVDESTEQGKGWNATLRAIREAAAGIDFDALKPVEKARIAHQALSFPVVASTLRSFAVQLKAAQDQLKAYEKADPAADPGLPGLSAPTEDKAPKGFLEGLEAALANK